jgi:hypothetical protein
VPARERILPAEGYKIVNLADMSERFLSFDKPLGASVNAVLCEGGAAFYMNYSQVVNEDMVLEVWRNDSLIHLSESLHVKPTAMVQPWGNYLVWMREGGILCLTDLNTMVTTYKGTNVSEFSVGRDGKLAYAMNGNIYLYDIGTGGEQQISNSNIAGRPIYNDGQIIYSEKRNPSGADSLILYNGVSSVSMGIPENGPLLFRDSSLIFPLINSQGQRKLFLRTPEHPGMALLANRDYPVIPDILGDNGRGLVKIEYGKGVEGRYYVDEASRNGFRIAGTFGNLFYQDSSFYVGLGNTLYRIGVPSASNPPELTGISADSAIGGELIKLKGKHLVGASSVTLGGVPAGINQVTASDTSLVVTVGSGASGDVIIVTSAGTDTLKQAFNFIPRPEIREVNPTVTLGRRPVVIKGRYFNRVSSVTFGREPAISFTVEGDSIITAIPNSGRTGDLVVTARGGKDTVYGYKFMGLPYINSISVTRGKAGTPVRLIGADIGFATAITVGGVPVASFTNVNSNTVDFVLGDGASGDVILRTPAGTAGYFGFVYEHPPVLKAFYQAGAQKGQNITITGRYLTGTTRVTLGGVRSPLVRIYNDSTVLADVGNGESGDVVLTTPLGSDTLSGFKFYGDPSMTGISPYAGKKGDTITISGKRFVDAIAVKFGDIAAASFIVVNDSTIKAVVGSGGSGIVSVVVPAGAVRGATFTYQYGLPADNFALKNTNVTCRNARDGSIAITAVQALNYTGIISRTGWDSTFKFNGTVMLKGLTAGTYTVCVGVNGQSSYGQCFTSVLTQPADLSVFVAVAPQEVVLNLGGGGMYNVSLNDSVFSTANSTLTLPVKNGRNTLSVSTDKYCQGTVYKEFNIGGGTSVYPNPFHTSFNMNLVAKRALVQVFDVNGRMVWSKVYLNQAGVVNIDLPVAATGLYVVKVSADGVESNFKILKN